MQAGEAGIAYFFRGSGKNITYETFTTDSAGSFFVRTFEDGEWTQNLATHNAPDIVLGPGAKNDLLVVVHGTHVNYWINRKQVAALDDESGGDPPWQVGLYGSAPDSRPGQWTFTSFDVGK